MMKYQMFSVALLLAILLSLNLCHAQEKRFSFEEITLNCECPDFEWNSSSHRELKSISKSANDLEIRLDIFAKWNDRIINVISRKDGKYEGYFYHKQTETFPMYEKDSVIKYKGKWERYNFKKFQLEDINLDSVVKLLLSHQITTLPNQNEIYKKGFLSPYLLSYKIDGKTRSFRFGSPEDPMKEYPDEPVYRHYDAILKTFFSMVTPMYSQIRRDIQLKNEKEQRDTIFLRKPNTEGHAVYVDKDGEKSPYFTELTNLDYTRTDKSYRQSIKELLQYRKTPNKNISFGDLPRNWVQLHVYKGRFYVYSPSSGPQRRISLNDSTMIVQEMERSLRLMNDVQQNGKNIYQVSTTDYKGKTRSFQINLIHKSRGIAVFEDYFGKGSHALMVTIERASRFPLVTNYSPNHIEPEFVFDTPNFQELLNPEQY